MNPFQAEGLGMNPLYLMFPACFATSFSFMLPVATPPNAIAFSYGRLKVWDMVSQLLLLNNSFSNVWSSV